MKRIIIVAALSMPAGMVHSVPAGIPVFDATNILVWTAELQKWKDAILVATHTVDQLTETHRALVGITNLQDVFTNPLLWQYMPDNFLEVYQQGVDMGLGALFTEALELYDAAFSNDVCKWIENEKSRNICHAQQTTGYNMSALASKITRNAEQRQDQIDRAKEKLKTTELPKDAMALQTAIAAETASLQAEMMRLQALEMAQRANDEMLAQQQSQLARRIYDINEPIVLDDYVPGSVFE